MLEIDKEIEQMEKTLEAYKQAYIECFGALKYLKAKKEDQEKSKEEKKKDK